MRRNLLKIFIPAIILLLYSCSGSPGAIIPNFTVYDGVSPAGVQLYIESTGIAARDKAVAMLAEEFSRENRYGISVSMAADSEEADIFLCGPPEASEKLRKRKGVELSPLIYHPRWGLDGGRLRFLRPARQQTDYWDLSLRVTGIPLIVDSQVLLVNSSKLEQAGFRKVPSSWPFFNILLRRLSSDGFSAVGMSPNSNTLINLIHCRGGHVTAFFGKKYSLNNPVVNRTLRWLRRKSRKGLISLNSTEYRNQASFAFGETGMLLTGVDGIGSCIRLKQSTGNDFNIGVGVFPSRRIGDSMTAETTAGVIVSEKLEKQLASWLFLKWLIEEPQQLKIAAATGAFPAVKSAAEKIIEEDNLLSPQWRTALELFSSTHLYRIPELHDFTDAEEGLETLFSGALDGKWIWLESLKLNYRIKKVRRNEREKAAGKR